MDYLVSKVALMVTAIALSRGRHYFYCLLFFYIWALYKLATPSADSLGMAWYWVCASAEVVLICLALIVKPNGCIWIITASTIQILANTISTYTHALYEFYPNLIRSCEIAQCLVLILWSPIALKEFENLHNRLQQWKGHQWMRRLLRLI